MKFKTFKEFLSEKGHNEEAYKALEVAQKAELRKNYESYSQEEIAKAISEKQDKAQIQVMIDKSLEGLSELATKAQLEDLTSKLEAQGLAIAGLKNKGVKNDEPMTTLEIIKQNKDVIKNVFEKGEKATIMLTKAPALNSSVTSTISHRDNVISPLASRKLTMYEIFNKIRIGANENNTVVYIDWDEETTERAAGMVSEGLRFPESTAKWVEKSIQLKKIGDSMPMSEEFTIDQQRFAGEIDRFLETNVALVEDDQLLSGNGVGQNISGVDSRSIVYTPVASGIQDASFYDLVPKVREAITKGRGNKFQPNVCIMNLTEINKYKLKKDANNNYVMPPFVGADGNIIDGSIVIENNNVPNDVAYIGDSRFGTIYEGAEGYSLSMGHVDAQFLEDMKTAKVRKRLNLLIKDSERSAWMKVESISGALVTLQTV